MILSTSIIKCRSASKYKFEIKFEFEIEVVVEVMVEVVVVAFLLVRKLRQICSQ